MMTLRNRLQKARQNFIFYYQRGESEQKWKRSFSMYFMWAFEDDNNKMDWELFDLWAKVTSFYSANDQYERALHQFDLVERMVKIPVFI